MPQTFLDTLASRLQTGRIWALHLFQWVSQSSLLLHYWSYIWLQSGFGSALFYGKKGLINCKLYFGLLSPLSLNPITRLLRATRRRHGIPDNDLRPFNVAYSAAMTRAREEESRNRVKSNPSLRLQGRLFDRHDTQPEQSLRYRPGAFDLFLITFHLITNLVPQQKLNSHLEKTAIPSPVTSKAIPLSKVANLLSVVFLFLFSQMLT